MHQAMKYLSPLVLGLLLSSCATGDTIGNSTIGSGGNGSSSGNGGSGGSANARSDAIPQNGIGFFQMPACPAGWQPFKAAAGRAILPTIGAAPGGSTAGEPLASGEERVHSHEVKGTLDLIDISYAGIASGGNTGVAKAGSITFTTTSDTASAGIPYVQLLACKKTASPEAGAKPLPTGMQLFFDAAACPNGWKQAPATQGRFIVGLPKGAPADVSFGGEPLSSAAPREHTHGNEVSLETTSHGIALAAGCCGSGYAKNATYSAIEDTAGADAALPWIELLHCEKF